jgi:hypothetical protein
MINKKVAACVVALFAIAGLAHVFIQRGRRISALEGRMDEVERDVNATVQMERMRTVLRPFPGGHTAGPQDGRDRTAQA